MLLWKPSKCSRRLLVTLYSATVVKVVCFSGMVTVTTGEELSMNPHGFYSHTTNWMWWVVVDVGQNECRGHIMHMKQIRELKQYLVNQAHKALWRMWEISTHVCSLHPKLSLNETSTKDRAAALPALNRNIWCVLFPTRHQTVDEQLGFFNRMCFLCSVWLCWLTGRKNQEADRWDSGGKWPGSE